MTERCGRLTAKGALCKSKRMSAPWVSGYKSPACYLHATPEERLENAHLHALDEDGWRLTQATLPVDCWAWPVTAEHLARAAEANACADIEQGEQLAMRLLYDWQDGRCAVCGGDPDFKDHDHDTGLIRGLLCRFCNGQEGGVVGFPGNRFERYRKQNPASMLGLRIRYWSPFTGYAEPGPTAEERFESSVRVAKILAGLLLPPLPELPSRSA